MEKRSTMNTTTNYRITSSEGADMGVYTASTAGEALDEMARDAGYESQEDAVSNGIAPFDGTVEEVARPDDDIPNAPCHGSRDGCSCGAPGCTDIPVTPADLEIDPDYSDPAASR